ncbi:methionyl-tRNA formyltransferase [Vallitalea sp.]|uniref:methionyl-tRNA formyltransferase n=1 Tax=Vallitalea sp. TaxID=1882829 RepID=UPI0025D0A99C|nr:methionyl-tRNA formyltransferase [Vallitalea sp.]MCT4687366.1 methionyl-tRNA formyltransferase [Vallitalea sp.]
MKVVFMGTPDFSVPTLQELINSEHEVVAVVTKPDKPKGRGNKVLFTPIKEVAISNDIDVYQPQKLSEKDFVEAMEHINPDVIVVIAFGKILPKRILDLPKYGCINVHASLLPKYRGAGPIQWSIINGEAETGITTMYMDVGLDTGDMLLKEAVKIEDTDTGGSLHDKLSNIGAKLLIKTLKEVQNNTINRVKQNSDESTYAPMLEKSLGNINWENEAYKIELLIRGLNPWPSAYTYLGNKILKIWAGKIIEHSYDGKHGEIVDILKDGFIVKCKKQCILIKEVQLQGKKRMSADAFLRGYKLEVGEILGRR